MPQGGITRSQENIFQVFATYSQTLSQGYFGTVGKPFQKKSVTAGTKNCRDHGPPGLRAELESADFVF